MRSARSATLVGMMGLLLIVGCGEPPESSPEPVEETIVSVHASRGVVQAIEEEGARLIIAHEEMPDFMDAMTMPFDVGDPDESAGLAVGDKIGFELVMATKRSYVRNIQPLPTETELSLAP